MRAPRRSPSACSPRPPSPSPTMPRSPSARWTGDPARLRARSPRRRRRWPRRPRAACDGDRAGRRPRRSRRPTAAPSTPGRRSSHLRFGPAEEDNAGFAIAFWPDTRGATPRDARGADRGRGPGRRRPGGVPRRLGRGARALRARLPALRPRRARRSRRAAIAAACSSAITADLAGDRGTAMLARWRDPWAGILTSAGAPGNPLYLAPEESTRALYSALADGLQADIDLRLGRPLGTFDRPQPRRAEAWRSGRSLRNVVASLAGDASAAPRRLRAGDRRRTRRARSTRPSRLRWPPRTRVGEPIDVAVATPQGRVRVEALQQRGRATRGPQVAESRRRRSG